MRRISIAGLLGFVAVLAFGLAALVRATEWWAGATFALTAGLLLASVLGVILRGWRGGGWLGFAVFGWGYILLGNIPGPGLSQYPRLLTDNAANWIFWKANPLPAPPTRPPMPTIPPPPVAPGSLSPPIPAPVAPGTPDMSGAIVDYRPSPEQIAFEETVGQLTLRSENARPIAYWLSVLAFAGAGAVVGSLLARGRRVVEPAPSPPGVEAR